MQQAKKTFFLFLSFASKTFYRLAIDMA